MYFGSCDSPACICGHLTFFCKEKLYRASPRDYIGIEGEIWTELYFSYQSDADDRWDTKLGNLDFMPTKDDAVFMLKHLLKTKGEEVRWQKPT